MQVDARTSRSNNSALSGHFCIAANAILFTISALIAEGIPC